VSIKELPIEWPLNQSCLELPLRAQRSSLVHENMQQPQDI
jgi:hypothetical protein